MLTRFATLAAVCLLTPISAAPVALADPPADPSAQPVGAAVPAPPPPNGVVASAPPGVLDTPDGYHLVVSGKDETQIAVAPLTTALSSREYLVGGTFTGAVSGSGKGTLTGGSLEAGYQIGCGIIADDVELIGSAGFTPTISAAPNLAFPISGQIKVDLKPGTVAIVPVDKKTFKGKAPRITITG
ncbi:MAG TPA: MspA family porin, partial [Mycobacterium sp.]|nr:MspA family porin [Mycobacterium sp.]